MATDVRSALSPAPLDRGPELSVLRRRRWNYNLGGVLVRAVADCFMSNLGLLFGFLVTFLYSALPPTQNLTALRSLVYGWLWAALLLTLLCFLALEAVGAYGAWLAA